MLLNRKLLKINIQNSPFAKSEINNKIKKTQKYFNISKEETKYFVFSDKLSNSAYNIDHSSINILMKDRSVIDITSASDNSNIKVLNKTVNKYFMCYPLLK